MTTEVQSPPMRWALLMALGPSLIWAAEYIGSGEVILATRSGAILGTGILWVIAVGVFLKFCIGLGGARYTVCTGEGMVDMFARLPGGKVVVWAVFIIQFLAGCLSMGAIASATGIFLSSLLPVDPKICSYCVAAAAVLLVWSGLFEVLKVIMSILVGIIVLGVLYIAAHVFPSLSELLQSLVPNIPPVPEWAINKGINANPWSEILPLLGWGAGGFASQVWYTYWVLGAGYGAAQGRGYGRSADLDFLKNMSRETALKIRGWCRVMYVDATIAMAIGIGVTSCFMISGAGILRAEELVPEKTELATTLSKIFSGRWGETGGMVFLISGSAALFSTLIGQLAGWPRLMADAIRLSLPDVSSRYLWKVQFRFFLCIFVVFLVLIVARDGYRPAQLVMISAVVEGLMLTPFQALWVAIGLYLVLPKLMSEDAAAVLKAPPLILVGLSAAFLVFGYFCVIQIPNVLAK